MVGDNARPFGVGMDAVWLIEIGDPGNAPQEKGKENDIVLIRQLPESLSELGRISLSQVG